MLRIILRRGNVSSGRSIEEDPKRNHTAAIPHRWSSADRHFSRRLDQLGRPLRIVGPLVGTAVGAQRARCAAGNHALSAKAMTGYSTTVCGGPVCCARPDPVTNRAYGFTGSSPSISMWCTAMNGCRRRKGFSCVYTWVQTCLQRAGLAAWRRRCRVCDGRWESGSIAGCTATQRC